MIRLVRLLVLRLAESEHPSMVHPIVEQMALPPAAIGCARLA